MAESSPVPKPLNRYRGDFVETEYPDANGAADYATRRRLMLFLIEREDHTEVSYSPTPPLAIREVRYEEGRRWGILGGPKGWLASLVAVNAVWNIGINAQNLGTVGENAWRFAQNSYHRLFGDEPQAPPLVRQERRISEDVPFSQQNEAGLSEPDAAAVESILDQLDAANAQQSDIESITIVGSTSDEWRYGEDGSLQPGRGIGVADPENQNLGTTRAARVKAFLVQRAAERGIELEVEPQIEDDIEKVLGQDQIQQLRGAAAQTGLGADTDALIDRYSTDPTSLPLEIREQLDDSLAVNRGAQIDVVLAELSQSGSRDIVSEGYTAQGYLPYDWDLQLIPVPPIPVRRKAIIERERVTYIEQDPTPDPELVKLLPSALTENGKELVPAAYAKTRKYYNLHREEGRITTVYELDHLDADGQVQTLRAQWIDHAPTVETSEWVADMLLQVAGEQRGKVGENLFMVSIFPTDNVGQHRHIKKVGLGMDMQHTENTLGVAYSALGIVELYMPARPTREQLEGLHGAKRTVGHEIAHMQDLDGRHREVKLVNESTKVFALKGGFADSAESAVIADVSRQRSGTANYLVETTVDGQVVVNAVRQNDPRLGTADRVLREGPVSPYAMSSVGEAHAEATAAAKLPFSFDVARDQLGDTELVKPEEGKAQGYGPSPAMMQHLSTRLALPLDENGFGFVRPEVTVVAERFGEPATMADIAEMMTEARSTPLPADRDFIKILTPRRFDLVQHGETKTASVQASASDVGISRAVQR